MRLREFKAFSSIVPIELNMKLLERSSANKKILVS